MSTAPSWLHVAARDATGRPWTLGALLQLYAEREHCTMENLAGELGCRPELLQRIALCRRPRDDRFAEDIATVASRFDVDPVALLRIARHAAVVGRIALSIVGGAPALMAARDRDDSEGPS